ncbi:MAG: alpha/beta hydrolase [Pseudomonadota bacterium]|nr:alpha/beta hydrolase [Pseudomonadota bacterium]
MNRPAVLILPGWQGSGPGYWQTRWEALHGYQRVEQHDWRRPLRGDWTARLEEAVLSTSGPLLLAAHGLGCILAAWWAAHSRHVARVAGALLVAPLDVEREDLRQRIPGWAPVARQRLPFKSILVASGDDPFCGLESASRLAADWGSDVAYLGARGSLGADSSLGDWGEGHALLLTLSTDVPMPRAAGA